MTTVGTAEGWTRELDAWRRGSRLASAGPSRGGGPWPTCAGCCRSWSASVDNAVPLGAGRGFSFLFPDRCRAVRAAVPSGPAAYSCHAEAGADLRGRAQLHQWPDRLKHRGLHWHSTPCRTAAPAFPCTNPRRLPPRSCSRTVAAQPISPIPQRSSPARRGGRSDPASHHLRSACRVWERPGNLRKRPELFRWTSGSRKVEPA